MQAHVRSGNAHAEHDAHRHVKKSAPPLSVCTRRHRPHPSSHAVTGLPSLKRTAVRNRRSHDLDTHMGARVSLRIPHCFPEGVWFQGKHLFGPREAVIALQATADRAAKRPAFGVHSLCPPLSPGRGERARVPSFCLPAGPAPAEVPAARDGWTPSKSIAGSLAGVPHVRLAARPPFLTELAGGQAALGEGAEPSAPWLPARRGPHQLLSPGPCLGDEPSQCWSLAERGLARHLLGLSGASQAQLPLLPALIAELGSNELEPCVSPEVLTSRCFLAAAGMEP